jgi:hypothetical protein
MRGDRDLDRLWQKQQAGDSIAGKFFDGLGKWLAKCQKGPDKTPLCLACKRTFCDRAQPPTTFLVTYSEDPRIDVIILTGVCRHCAEKSDTDLLTHGTKLTAKFLKGRVLGWSHHPATQATS